MELRTYIGQDQIVLQYHHLDFNNDIVFSNQSCHGHFISYSGLVVELMSEILERKMEFVMAKEEVNIYTLIISIQMGYWCNTTCCLGTSYANKKNDKVITVAFTGDGSLGSGYF